MLSKRFPASVSTRLEKDCDWLILSHLATSWTNQCVGKSKWCPLAQTCSPACPCSREHGRATWMQWVVARSTHEWQIVDEVAGESLSCWSLQASVVLGNLLDFGVSWGREISKVCILELTSCYGHMFQQVLKLSLPFWFFGLLSCIYGVVIYSSRGWVTWCGFQVKDCVFDVLIILLFFLPFSLHTKLHSLLYTLFYFSVFVFSKYSTAFFSYNCPSTDNFHLTSLLNSGFHSLRI